MENPKKRGGQTKPDEEKLIQRSVRMKQRQWDKVDAAGGQPWLRDVVDAAEMPPPKKVR